MKPYLLFPAALLTLGAASPPGRSIEIHIADVKSNAGVVRVDVCPEASFLKECAYSGSAPAHAGTTVVTIANVPPGRYAAQAFQDANDNGKVDRGLFGIPLEGVGFSNDAKIRMAPPKFAEAAFDHGDAPQRIGFHLRYFIR